MKQKIILYILIPLSFLANRGLAQNSNLLPLTADSLASGNYKDVLSGFFQLAVNRLIGTDKEIRFTSNPFAVMAKMNPELLIDTNYLKYTHWRNLNFSFAGKLDPAYHFNGFSSSVKYALINKRDETVSKAFVSSAFKANNEYNILNNELNKHISEIPLTDRTKIRSQLNKIFKGELDFSKLDPAAQLLIKKTIAEENLVNISSRLENNPKLSFGIDSKKIYDSLLNLFQNKLLWTAGISDTTYENKFLFSNLVLSSELVKGIVDPSKSCNVEIDIKSAFHFVDDSTKAGRNLQRNIFNFEPGLNLVLKSKATHQSWAEFKLSGSYNHTFRGLYKNEKQDSLTINGTFRIRIINDIWIPLEFKYDPKSGNIFGLLNLRLNFTGIRRK